MNSIWNKNIARFKERFPRLFELIKGEMPEFNAESITEESDTQFIEFLNKEFPFYNFSRAKNNSITASVNTEEGSTLALHSAYNPEREAESAANENIDKEILIFAGLGLGYTAAAFAKAQASKTIIIVEPDARHFFAALAALDLSTLFKVNRLFFIIGASVQEAASLVEGAGGFENAKIFSKKSQTCYASAYFDEFFKAAEKSRQKDEVNTNTLERFGMLWLKNSARNLKKMQELDGISIFENAATLDTSPARYPAPSARSKPASCPVHAALPAVILAAGPTLSDTLCRIKEIHNRAVTIALDTSLRAVLKAGVEPDFVVLTDPQYWASRHISGLCSPSSVLITEGAVYPSVFRFECRKSVLISSLFPLGKFVEARLGKKGEIASGGSVSTSAWEFAKYAGFDKIFFAGLDLGYPENKTHARPSTFEEEAHLASRRTSTAESALCGILFSAGNKKRADYNGDEIITDDRMTLFAWWFEKKARENPAIKNYVFSKKSLAISGFEFFAIEDFLKLPDARQAKKAFFERAEKMSATSPSRYPKEKFDATIKSLKDALLFLGETAKNALDACDKIIANPEKNARLFSMLEEADKKILSSEAKSVAALVFPTQRQLQKIMDTEKTNAHKNGARSLAAQSRVVYAELAKAVDAYLKHLP